MSDALLEWPAFAPGKSLPSGEIRSEHGVWGKVPGARTDFRWLARSSDLERDEPGLARQLSLGAEDQPEKAQLWLNRGDRYYAAGLYPSRARDASGRTDFLEKQVLAWTRPDDTPAALGALLLLPHVASLNADVWWDRSGDRAWEDPGFALQLFPSTLTVKQEDLASKVSQGVGELREVVGHDNLKRLYAQILARRRPAWLTGLERPLSPQALAVLLLPLHYELANSLSLAGWLPSSRASIEDLAARWDVIVVPSHLADMIRPQEVTPEAERQGEELSRALLKLSPKLAQSSYEAATASLELLDSIPFAEPPGEQARDEEDLPLSRLAALHPDARIPLPDPPKNASDLLRELHAFACTVSRRWLDLDRSSRKAVSQLESIPESLFPSWIVKLQKQKPEHVDPEQWKVKLDLLRSAALVLQPKTDMLGIVGLPETRRVPALLFLLLLSKRDLLAEMNEETLRRALHQSLTCTPSRWTRRLRGELADWQARTRQAWLRPLIQAELDATRLQKI